MFIFIMLSCLFLAALRSPAGKGLISFLSPVCDVLLCFVSFPYGVSGQALYLIISSTDLRLLL